MIGGLLACVVEYRLQLLSLIIVLLRRFRATVLEGGQFLLRHTRHNAYERSAAIAHNWFVLIAYERERQTKGQGVCVHGIECK